MQNLSEGDREVLLLEAWEGLRPSEIAELLSLPPETVRTRLHRARVRLRRELEPLIDPDQMPGAERLPAARKERT
jgi:RNA polymerase sigma-70 factor (ECF subfamily)